MTTRNERADFDATVMPHIDELYGTAVRLTRSGSDAEDLVQEAVMRAWAFWNRFEKGTNARAWMHRILRNTFINGYRKKKRERELLQAARDEQTVKEDRGGLRRAIGEALGDEVEAALSAIPEDFRRVVLLVDLRDMSYKEAAEELGCPIGTVMSRLHRGRRLLQERLRGYAQREGYIDEAA